MKRLLWPILIFSFLLFSLAPTVYEWSQKDKLSGRTFEPVHNYITDYNFYLSRIRQGMEGRWTVVEQYTSEEHQGSCIQIFYLLLGKPVAFFSDKVLGATIAYHGARMLFALIFLALISRACIRMFRSLLWQVLGFLTIVTASTIPIVVSLPDSWRLGGYMSWWTVMDSLQRITFMPHILFGQAAIIFLVCDLFDIPKHKTTWWLLGKFIAAFCLGMVFPPGILFVGVIYGVQSGIEFFSTKKTVWFKESLLPRIVVLSGGFPTLLYYGLMMTLSPWRRLVEFDQLNPTHFSFIEYGKAVGPVLVFGMIGGVVGMVKKEKQVVVYVSWIVAWLLVLFIFQFIPQQSPLRFTEMAPHVPLGMLTVYLFFQCNCFVHRLVEKRKNYPVSGISYLVWKIGKPLLFIILNTLYLIPITLGLGVMYSSYLWQKDFINQKVGAGWPAIPMNNVIVYPITSFTDGLRFIEIHTPPDAIILSDVAAGNYIPPHTGRRVFVGHDNTVDKEKKLIVVRRFFQEEMTADEAYTWIVQNHIIYVFFGPQEQESKKNIARLYPFLREVYKNSGVTIFSVNPAK